MTDPAGHYVLSAETSFSAAHTLPGVDGCERFHGHNWRVRLHVAVRESDLDAGGMGVDFRVIQEIARQAVEDFDHRYLNDLEPFRHALPTAERLAKVVWDRAATLLIERRTPARVAEVEVWETPDFRVAYHSGCPASPS